jgi:hypothetical protein
MTDVEFFCNIRGRELYDYPFTLAESVASVLWLAGRSRMRQIVDLGQDGANKSRSTQLKVQKDFIVRNRLDPFVRLELERSDTVSKMLAEKGELGYGDDGEDGKIDARQRGIRTNPHEQPDALCRRRGLSTRNNVCRGESSSHGQF